MNHLQRQPRRRGLRYAPDAQVRRAFKLAQDQGLNPAAFRLGGDGSVLLLDRQGALIFTDETTENPDDALAAWEEAYSPARR